MQEKFNKNLEQVKRIIEELDSLRFGETKAEQKYSEGNKLLDQCVEILNKKKFKVDEISLKSGKIVPKEK